MNAVVKLRVLAPAFATTLLCAGFVPQAQAADTGSWVPAWTASPQPTWAGDFALPLGLPASLRVQTVRQVVRAGVGGSRVRIVLSNEYGTQPLQIGAAHIALAGDAVGSTRGPSPTLTFGGQAAATVPAGAILMSDPVDFNVAPLHRLAVSLYFPQTTPLSTIHWDGLQPAQIAAGNATEAASAVLAVASPLFSYVTGQTISVTGGRNI